MSLSSPLQRTELRCSGSCTKTWTSQEVGGSMAASRACFAVLDPGGAATPDERPTKNMGCRSSDNTKFSPLFTAFYEGKPTGFSAAQTFIFLPPASSSSTALKRFSIGPLVQQGLQLDLDFLLAMSTPLHSPSSPLALPLLSQLTAGHSTTVKR